MKPLIVVGTGSFGEVAAAYFDRFSDYQVLAFAVSESHLDEKKFAGRNVYPIESLSSRYPVGEVEVFVAVGYRKMNQIRQALVSQIESFGFSLTSFVHPEVDIWDRNSIGKNCFIFEDNTIQPFTQVGDNTILWSGNHIGHHSRIGSNTFISSHVVVSGSCQIGNNVFIGVNSTLHDGIKVGDFALIGAGVTVSRDLDDLAVITKAPDRPRDIKSSEVDF